MTPSPFSAGNSGNSRGGIIDLPTPKRAANVYVGRKAAVQSAADLSALEMTSDGELPALLGDLNLDEALDPALLALDGAGMQPAASMMSLDLTDLPAPVGPRPRSPLSTRGGAASAASVPRSMLPLSPRGPSSKPGIPSEPEPLPAPPTRDPLLLLGETMPPASAVEGKRVSRPDLARFPLVESAAAPPPAERVPVPSAAFSPAQRETQPSLRRSSPSGAQGVAKPVHSLFDASEPAPPPAAPRPTEATPPMLPLPALPSDESGGKGPAATSAANSASGSISESSGQSFITGGAGTSSTATTEPKPLRLGYLIVALAVLALLLALTVARIAGIWNQQAGADREPHPTSSSPNDSGRRPSP